MAKKRKKASKRRRNPEGENGEVDPSFKRGFVAGYDEGLSECGPLAGVTGYFKRGRKRAKIAEQRAAGGKKAAEAALKRHAAQLKAEQQAGRKAIASANPPITDSGLQEASDLYMAGLHKQALKKLKKIPTNRLGRDDRHYHGLLTVASRDPDLGIARTAAALMGNPTGNPWGTLVFRGSYMDWPYEIWQGRWGKFHGWIEGDKYAAIGKGNKAEAVHKIKQSIRTYQREGDIPKHKYTWWEKFWGRTKPELSYEQIKQIQREEGLRANPMETVTDIGYLLAEASRKEGFGDVGAFPDEIGALRRGKLIKKGRSYRTEAGEKVQVYHATAKGKKVLTDKYPDALRNPRKKRGKMPPADLPPSIPGLEGPFRYKTGFVLYWDPKEGQYYDRGKDLYLSIEEAEAAMGTKNPTRRGVKPWITRPGKLGGKGFLTKPRVEQKRLLDKCEREYGYRSCLGSVMVLSRNREIEAKYGRTLGTLRRYLVQKQHKALKGQRALKGNPKRVGDPPPKHGNVFQVVRSGQKLYVIDVRDPAEYIIKTDSHSHAYDVADRLNRGILTPKSARSVRVGNPSFTLIPEISNCEACRIKSNPGFEKAISEAELEHEYAHSRPSLAPSAKKKGRATPKKNSASLRSMMRL